MLPTYNSENYIAETLWSVFDQSCQDFEVLIINEAGSSNETIEVIQLFEDNRIRLVQNETRLGLAESLNEGIRLQRGSTLQELMQMIWLQRIVLKYRRIFWIHMKNMDYVEVDNIILV